MKDQITVIDNGVTNQNVELISYFELIDSGKKYLFYTLNETVENGLIKMYAARAQNEGKVFTLVEKMTDEEWNYLKSFMKTILTGGTNSNVKYIYID